jgi:hypothetical protein
MCSNLKWSEFAQAGRYVNESDGFTRSIPGLGVDYLSALSEASIRSSGGATVLLRGFDKVVTRWPLAGRGDLPRLCILNAAYSCLLHFWAFEVGSKCRDQRFSTVRMLRRMHSNDRVVVVRAVSSFSAISRHNWVACRVVGR